MAKGKTTWKYNKLLTARRNYFDEGGDTNIFRSAGSDIMGFFKNPGAALSSPTMGVTSMLGAAAGAVGQIGGQLLSNGLESKAGGIISGVGDALGGIPILGGFAKGAFNLIGGGVNALIGSKLNQANINAAKNDIARMNNATADASDFDSLNQKIATTAGRTQHDKKFYGRDGAFSNKAKEEQKKLEAEAKLASERQDLALIDNAEALSSNQLSGLEATYAAFGGPLGFGDGAIGFDFMNRYIKAKEATAYGNGDMTSLPNSFALGGSTHGADFTNGMVFIDNGGSHESNPFEGVPMGVDANGIPNLVEEGETIYNDYVFSKRLTVPKAVRNKYRLRGTKDISFAEASKQLAKESEERPNDPISQRGLQALMSDLAYEQENMKANREGRNFSVGGKLFWNGGYKWYGQDSSDEMQFMQNGSYTDDYRNYVGGITQADMAANYAAIQRFYNNATDEQKKTRRWKNLNAYFNANPTLKTYDFSSGTLPDGLYDFTKTGALDGKIGGRHYGIMSAEQRAAMFGPDPVRNTDTRRWLLGPDKDANGTPLDPYATATLIEDYNPDNAEYNYVTQRTAAEGDTDFTDFYYRKLESDPTVPEPEEEPETPELDDDMKPGKYADWLRYAPAVGYGIGVLTDLFGLTNKPDYSNADAILEATRTGGSYQPVKFNPIGNYLAYNPLDRDYYLNKMSAEAGSTRRAIMQNAGMNRGAGMAALLAADNNTQSQIGTLARQAEEYNLAQRQQVEDFNRATNNINSQGFLQADTANQRAQAEMKDFTMKGTIAAAQMREAARQSADAAKSANLSGLFQTLGDIGYEERNAKMRDWAIRHGVFGPGTEDYGRNKTTKAANGGKIKRRKGLTF